MAIVYITEETKNKLDVLANLENRTTSKEVDFLCDKRLSDLTPSDTTTNPPVTPS